MALKESLSAVGYNLAAGLITGLVAYLIYKYADYLLKAHFQAVEMSGPLGFLQRGIGYAPGLIIGGLLARAIWAFISRTYLAA